MKRFIAGVMIAAILALSASTAMAHGVWLGVRCDKTCIVLGDGPKDNAYSPSMVTGVRGFTADHAPVQVGINAREDHVELDLDAKTAFVKTPLLPSRRSSLRAG